MAAIKPHLEEQTDPSETPAERRYSAEGTFEEKVEAQEHTDGLGDEFPLTPDAHAALQASHAELLRMTYTRRVIGEQLKERSFTVEAKTHQDGTGEIFLILDAPIPGAIWNAAGGGDIRRVKLLSWTAKMGTPSLSLPAGALQMGGTCPGAVGGQSIVPADALETAQKLVTRTTKLPVLLADSICERCYATGGNYYYGSNALAQMIREMWIRASMKDGTFVDTMSWAVDHANYRLEGGTVKGVKGTYEPERFPGRYFRIHDSGDFFDPKYLQAWKSVTNNFKTGSNKITFWAPTRIWATNWGIVKVNEVNSDPGSNLIIRPSTYHINEVPPKNLGDGWSAWSECWSKSVKDEHFTHVHAEATGKAGVLREGDRPAPFAWDCQAYAVKDEAHSCRNARGPKRTGSGPHNDTGCRACWVNADSSVNYTEH